MYLTMATAALLIDAAFRAAGLVPTHRPNRDQVFGQIALDYKLVLNVFGLAVFAALFALTIRHGVTDPVCHMTVDRAKAKRLTLNGATGARDRLAHPLEMVVRLIDVRLLSFEVRVAHA
jgi:hypothetical protein